ncbi:hypothetical protein D3C71_221930 [compost metagenome]
MPRPQTPLFRNPTRALVRSILEEAVKRPGDRGWTLQGFGMLRAYLSDDMRLHVWCPDLAVPGVSTIHDHPWRFSSFVIAGIVENFRYEVDYEDPVDAENVRNLTEAGWQAFMARNIIPGQGLSVVGEDTPVWIRRLGLERVRAGAWYFQEPQEVHESRPAPGTVTLIQRQRVGEDVARTFYPRGAQWVSGEPRAATNAEVVHACEGAIGRWLS